MTKKYNLRIPENLQIIMNTQESNTGLIVKFHPDLWAIFKPKDETKTEYGFQLLNPNGNERGEFTWGLTMQEASRLINKLIKNPSYGFGKSKEQIEATINKIITKIKKTYV